MKAEYNVQMDVVHSITMCNCFFPLIHCQYMYYNKYKWIYMYINITFLQFSIESKAGEKFSVNPLSYLQKFLFIILLAYLQFIAPIRMSMSFQNK